MDTFIQWKRIMKKNEIELHVWLKDVYYILLSKKKKSKYHKSMYDMLSFCKIIGYIIIHQCKYISEKFERLYTKLLTLNL